MRILLLCLTFLITVPASAAAAAAAARPSTGNDWISLSKGHEFQPASGNDLSGPQKRALRHAQERFLTGSQAQSVQYADSKETQYDGYAQAWRYVGFYTDCNPNQQNDRHRRLDRQLGEGDDDVVPCQKYLLWAAYVDLNYQGLGTGEYQYYNTYTDQWDTSACKTTGTGINADGTIDETKCKKMDCHLPNNSNWQLLGYFKEVGYMDWFEQLFKHEGYCIWQKGEEEWMYNNCYSWPDGCTEAGVYLQDGTALYYDLKVGPNATMGVGLYTNSRCSVDYMGDEVTVQTVVGGEDDGILSSNGLKYWNKAMNIYRVCQPCRSYNLNQNDGNRKRKLENDDPNNGLFQCNDAAGYTNVNQCYKFRTKTNMQFASMEEVLAAAQQDAVTGVYENGKVYGQYMTGVNYEAAAQTPNWHLLKTACAILAVGIAILVGAVFYSHTHICHSERRKSLRQPLMVLN